MSTEQTPGTLVREIREYLGANVHLSGVEDSMLDDAALELARVALRQNSVAADGIWERLKNPLTPYGSLVRALRGVAGTSLMEMSKATDYSPAHLSAVEFGRSDVSHELISATRRFFNDKGLGVTALILQQAADARRIEGESNA